MTYIKFKKYPELSPEVKKHLEKKRERKGKIQGLYREAIREINTRNIGESIEGILHKW